MIQSFIYNGKSYTTNNLNNKLHKMGLSINDIKLIDKSDLGEIDTSTTRHHFKNIKTGYSITTIKDYISDYLDVDDIENWIQID